MTPPFAPDSPVGRWRDHVLARPKASSETYIGEDFFYIQEMRGQSGISLGVADGVGGWTTTGDDPALFSQALMYHAHRYSKTSWAGEPEIDPTLEYEEREKVEGWELSPAECLEFAYGGVLREQAVHNGSSTACIVNLNTSSGVLRAANLGDSGFCIIRSSTIIYEQKPQTHFFNCPNPFTQTDGLSDNVFMPELTSICALVSKQFIDHQVTTTFNVEDTRMQVMADRIVDYARLVMHKTKRVSPFQLSAQREGMYFPGGKVDE
ncbi:hypothetical protein EUX98_g7789 [Antrodiella citrinella]|uniref:Protein phosphatase n=1 Tax=Antrodiella citrinella TaxID=2447956 RepID=A0A4S4MN08_9APHY|nr:hypothetical protein EUX98_g7789 [Antrodiella citrinella]